MPFQHNKQFINGEWKTGQSDKTIKNVNPYTGEEIGVIQSANEDDLDQAYQAAKKAQVEWASTVPSKRRNRFHKLLHVLKDEKEMIVDWLVKESGSTVTKANAEIDSARLVIEESMSYPTRMNGQILPSENPGKENYVYRKPKGVVGIIGPWNFPFHLAMRSIAPALATGNTAVLKPASDTPVSAGLLFGYLFEKAGFPAGVLNVVVGRGSEIGDAFVEHAIPKLISFTGSTEVGSHIAELAGKHLKETTLELGGNNAMLVLEDADIESAVDAAIFGKFLHQGQICMALNRIIVHEKVYDSFVSSFVQRAKELPAGDPTKKDVIVGPIINEGQLEHLTKAVKQAVEEGATLEIGGSSDNNVFEPTVLTNVTQNMEIAKTELFGPVAPIINVQSEEEAIQIANASPYGLSGSVFTKDRFKGMEVARQIETGMIHVNDQSVNDEAHVAFGGEKASGLGRFGGEWGLDKFTTVQWVGVQSGGRDFPF